MHSYAYSTMCALWTGLALVSTTSGTEPISKAHAHNDYEHDHPLFDALSEGFCSVEADVYAIDGELRVAHNLSDTRPGLTLEKLYLDPLRELVAKNHGSIYGDGTQLTLLIDFKSSGDVTYELLSQVLNRYRELFEPRDAKTKAPVQAVISGNRPFARLQADQNRLCGLDGRISDLDSNLPASIMPLISDNWGLHFRWRGDGVMPADERSRLHEIVRKAHTAGRRVRFWATPENESVWKELLAAEVDHINTDQLTRLAAFLCEEGNAKGSERSGPKLLIVHADDAGMSHSVNLGTIEALSMGLVTSASIMVPCPWFSEFAKHCREHPDGCYGIHLTLNSEWEHYRWGPVADPAQVPSLVDADGYLWDNVGRVAQHVKASEAKIELTAQIERALKFGVPLSHLDTHMGAVLSRPDLFEVYVDLGVQYGLPVLFVDNQLLAAEYPAIASTGAALQAKLEQANLPVLNNIGQFYGGDSHEQRREEYINFLRTLQPGLNQLIIHCGFDNEELRGITSSSARRDGDRLIFTDPAIGKMMQELGIELTTWKRLRAVKEEQ
ncbi:MAG: ChbG/HpnK family deacetylase [Planctomycetales bacterium]|nr:ChbG/HpnK family deacetylase [Planctomycetales bacterium]